MNFWADVAFTPTASAAVTTAAAATLPSGVRPWVALGTGTSTTQATTPAPAGPASYASGWGMSTSTKRSATTGSSVFRTHRSAVAQARSLVRSGTRGSSIFGSIDA